MITVVQPGLSCVQDLGRPRAAQVGQMTAGALDQYGARMANVLVGSPHTAPLIELVAQDFAAVSARDTLVAITGADADVTLDGRPQPQWEPVVWRAGQTLRIARLRAGLRCYVGIHGRIHADALLGSCAPDTVLGFGRSLTAGAELRIDTDCPRIVQPWFGVPFFRIGARPHPFGGRWDADVTPGPDAAEFGTSGERLLADFTVGARSNHIGLRLAPVDHGAGAGVPRRDRRTEVLSRGVPIGAVEVPEGDEILVLHRGRGVTAGYPVLAVVTSVGLSRLGQARPGDVVRFRRVTESAAVAAYRQQRHHLDEVRDRVRTVFTSLSIPHHDSPHHDRPHDDRPHHDTPTNDRSHHHHRTSATAHPLLKESA